MKTELLFDGSSIAELHDGPAGVCLSGHEAETILNFLDAWNAIRAFLQFVFFVFFCVIIVCIFS